MLNANGERRRRPSTTCAPSTAVAKRSQSRLAGRHRRGVSHGAPPVTVLRPRSDDGAAFASSVPGPTAIEALDERRHPPRRGVHDRRRPPGRAPGARLRHLIRRTRTSRPCSSGTGALRSTVVQVYDWMASYTEPLGPEAGWKDPSNRPVSFEALRALAAGLQAGRCRRARLCPDLRRRQRIRRPPIPKC